MISQEKLLALRHPRYGMTKADKAKYGKMYEHAMKLYELEDWNDHTGYTVYLATKIVRSKKAGAAARHIETLHEYFGHMLPGLITLRSEINEHLMAQLKEKLGRKDFDVFLDFLRDGPNH